MERDPAAVAVVIFDRAPMFETSVPMSVFGMDRSASGAPRFELLAVAGEDGPITTTGGLVVSAPHGLDALERASIVVLPSWRDTQERPPEQALAAIRAAHSGGAIIVSFCLGGFVLAATELLDGRRAVTHWFHGPTLAAMYPLVTVDPDVLFHRRRRHRDRRRNRVPHSMLVCTWWRDCGAQRPSAAIARRMAMPPRRNGAQPQNVEGVPLPQPVEKFADVMAFAVEHIAEPVDVDLLARKAMMSRRTFDRQFRGIAGISPMQWLLHQRVLFAQRLLEESEQAHRLHCQAGGIRETA